MGDYGYTFIIYTPQEWLALDNTLQVVPPTDPPVFGGGDMASRYAYEALRTTFIAYKRHKDATIRMIFHIFGTVVFLNLQDIHGFVVGHTPSELVAYLERIYVTPKQRRNDITPMDLKIRQPFTMDGMIEGFFMEMIAARFTLAYLNMAIDDAEMIRLCLVQFILNDEMNEPCEKLENTTVPQTYTNFCEFFIKQIIRIERRKETLATANIANQVKAFTNQATEILSGELLFQVGEIRELKALIEQNSAVPGNDIPSLVNTDSSSIMSIQFQAMKV